MRPILLDQITKRVSSLLIIAPLLLLSVFSADLSFAACGSGTGTTTTLSGSVTFTNTGDACPYTGTWTVPCGVTSFTVQVIGGGGGGGSSNTTGGSGGGGGGYATATFTSTPGTVFNWNAGVFGSGGAGNTGSGTAGGQTWFSAAGVLFANGGGGGTHNGGAVGSAGSFGGTAPGMTGSNGNVGQSPAVGTGTSGGQGGNSGQGSGGAATNSTANTDGSAGGIGGGGAGGYSTGGGADGGGNGGGGTIIITWTPPNAGPDQTLAACATSAILSANAPSAGNGQWTASPAAGVSFSPNANTPNATVNGLVPGTNYTLTWTWSNGGAGCTPISDQVVINTTPGPGCAVYCVDPSPPTSNIYGYITNVNLNGTTNPTGWNGYSNYSASVPCVSITQGSSYTFSVDIYNSSNGGIQSWMFIDWDGDGNFETSEGYDLGHNTTNPSTITYSNLISVPCGSALGSVRIRFSAQYSTDPTGCSNSQIYGEIEDYCITILPNTVVSAGGDQVLASCVNTANLSASPAGGYWTLDAGSGTLSDYNITNPVATVNGTSATFQYNAYGTGDCAAYLYTDEVTLTTTNIPSLSNAGPNQSVCGSTATLAGNVPTSGNGAWTYFTSPVGGPAPTFTPNNTTAGASLSNLGQGYTYSFIWTITHPTCPGYVYRDTMTIFNQATPTITSPVNNNQTVCVGNAIASIQYTLGGGATGATVTGLPPGVNYSVSAGVLTISGTPTNNAASPYNFTVTTSPSGPCTPLTRTGTITVNGPTISSPANMNQSVCLGAALATISFAIAGGATGATVTGLPPGVTGTYTAPNFVISGTPSAVGPFNYVVTTSGGCGPISRYGTITVNPNANAGTISGTSPICQQDTLTLSGVELGGGTGTWSSSNTGVATVNQSGVVSPVSAGTTTISYTITGGCGGTPSSTFNLTVNSPFDACACAGVLNINELGITSTLVGATNEPGETGGSCASGSFTYANQTQWFQFTATEPCQGVTVTTTNNVCIGSIISTLYSGTCGSLTQMECHDLNDGGGATSYFNRCDFVVGQTYYVQVAYYTATSCNTAPDFIVGFQTVNTDMCTARQICDADANTVAYNLGNGGVVDLSGANGGCMSGIGEVAPTWFVFQADATGELIFEMDPDGSGDYDFALWGPYTQEITTCAPPSSAPIRCTICGSANPFSLGGDNDTSEGSVGCNNALAPLQMQAGDIYYFMIGNWDRAGDPFTLTWNGPSTNCDKIYSLPIELISFSGEAIERENHLFWSTSSESNNAYFTVERTANGENWESIGRVQGAGNSQTQLDYSFIDSEPIPGVSYYRLKQTDFDGRFKYSSYISIAREFEAEGLFSDIYPNPTTDVFNVVYMGHDYNNPITISIYDYSGKQVQIKEQTEISNHLAISINTEFLPTGMYQVIMSQGDEKEIKKLSIIH